MLRIVDVDYVRNYELLLTFNDGVRKLVDLKPYLTGEVFGPLLDNDLFIQYGLTRNTIEWALNHCEDKIEYDGCFGDGDATRRIIEELYRLSGETNGTR